MSFLTILKAIKAKTQFEFCEIVGVEDYYSPEFYKALTDYIFPKTPTSQKKRTFDYDQDFKLLWADFKAVYNIDLFKDPLDWWEYSSLFERMILLDNVSGASKVIGYRAAKVPKQNKNNKDMIKHLREMKARYRIEDASLETVDRFFNNLKNMKDKNNKK